VVAQSTIAGSIESCYRQLRRLQSIRGDVSAALRQMSSDLLETGRAPNAESLETLMRFREDVGELQASLPRPADAPSMEAGANGPLSLNECQDELDALELIQTALTRLDCISRIRHVDQPDFPPWMRCREDGIRLHEDLLSAPAVALRETAEQFLASQSPLNAIVTLIADGSELSDDRWSLLLDSVSAAYGREISIAIARGKLIL
jgi:hypothetical protein